jgi:hypothetical protein
VQSFTSLTNKVKEESKNYNAWLRREKLRQYVYNWLATHPCVDCGEQRIPTLQFDHIDPALKRFNITEAVRRRVGLATLKIEIAKCAVRCANCHAIKTARDQGWYTRLDTDNTSAIQ